MVATLEEAKRLKIAAKLADMKLLQNQLISNEEKLAQATSGDKEISDRLQNMLQDDRENVGTIERAITQMGIQSDPNEKTAKMVEGLDGMMAGDELTLYEKASQHEAIKHQLVMLGVTLHKAAQTLGGDLEQTIDPINKVNFKNRAHQEQMKGVIQVLGTRELVGQNPDTSLWGQIEDGVAALKGVFGGLADV